jgi:2-keto-3-deoxy-L-rhamnonate aldolase RhmA
VAEAARKAGKAAGILLLRPDQVEGTVSDGFTFVALGSDSGLVANGMPQLFSAFEGYRSRSH